MPRVDDFQLGRSASFPLGATAEGRTDLSLSQSAPPTGHVRGRVTNSVGGSPLDEVTVKVRNQLGDPVAHTETNPGGNYTLSIVPGTYVINVAKHGFITPPGKTFTVQGGQVIDIDFVMTPETHALNVIYGKVMNDGTIFPVVGALVGVVSATDPSNIRAERTNSSGQFLCGDLPDGAYIVSVSASGFQEEETAPITVSGGVIVNTDITIEPVPVPQATVNGFIIKQDGTPIANALVGLYLLDQSGLESLGQVTFTDSRGFYIFARAVAGTYVVKAKSEKVVTGS